MRVVIFDIKFGNYIYHSTPTPSKETLLLSGYHKERGDEVVLTDSLPNFAIYDKVYLVKQNPFLFSDPSWTQPLNIACVGKGWGGMEVWKEEWDKASPDMEIYRQWINRWTTKYPKFSEKRLRPFFQKPVKIKQGDRIVMPSEQKCLIIDDDIIEWDPKYETMKEIDVKHSLLTPLVLDGRWKEALEYFEQRSLIRDKFWATFDINKTTEEDLKQALEIFKEISPSRMFRIKATVQAWSDQEWIEVLEWTYKVLEDFRMECGKRLFIEPVGHEGLMIERVIKELKRWCAKDNGYRRNSLFDYMIYDGCRDTKQIAEFLYEPYEYIAAKKHGQNKFSELIPIIKKYPEVMDIITKSYSKGGT